MSNIKIKTISVYHPEKQVDNEPYIQHFKEKGRDITHFLEDVMGRKKRYLIDSERENSITMAIEASKRALKEANLTGEDIDMIVFSSQVPEQVIPTNAIFIHHGIGGGRDCITYDQNANCAGMTIAVEQVSRYMMSSPHVKTALVVGSDYLSLVANPEEEITYANFGDASCAVILEKTEENTGFIDAIHETDSNYRNDILYPEKGYADVVRNQEFAGYISWKPFDGRVSLPYSFEKIRKLLNRNNMTIDDVDVFCFSQFGWSTIQHFKNEFTLPDEKIVYVGDEYGYTGTSSPFVTLYEGIQRGKIKRGDTILFWTIGGGHEFIIMLFKY